MKRLTIFLFSLCVFITFSATSAFAADTQGSNVTITVVMPDPASAPEPTPEPLPDIKVYPSDVTENRDGGVWQIVKTYELAANENPADIPRADYGICG